MIEPEYLAKNVAEMRDAADILRDMDAWPWAEMLTKVADATDAATQRPRSTAEDLTWTPVVVHAARLAHRVIETYRAASATPLRARTPVDDNSPADGVR